MTTVEVGSELGQYRIEQYIGRGGMGVVYRAQHAHLGRQVALKLLAPELAENESFRERFVRESRLAAAIDHPNVIPIYEADEVDGNYFIAMRYVDGVDLREVLHSQGSLPLERSLTVLTQIAGALDAAHAQGLVHRDVKPGNVLVVSGSDHYYLTDFGLTKAMSSDTAFTATGQFVGTTDYVAPEQIEGKELDRRTDVYALGCVFYECLTGSTPFRRETDMAVMWAHIQEPPPRVSDKRADLPAELDNVLATAMAKSKDDRYPSCSTFAAAARSALEVGTGRSFVSTAPAEPPTERLPQSNPAAFVAPPAPPAPPPAAPVGIPAGAYTNAGNAPPPPPYYGGDPYGYPPPAGGPPPKRQKPLTAIALIIAALLLAGGGTAAALILTGQKKDKPAASASAQTADTAQNVASQPETPTAEQTTPTTTAPTRTTKPRRKPATPSPPDNTAQAIAAEDVVKAHWQAIEDHRFSQAYRYLANGPGESGWVTGHQNDGIIDVQLDTSPGSVSGSSGTVQINSLVTEQDCGVQDWGSATVEMVKVGGQWLISDMNLSRTRCV
jgi:serine/threonine-protein kinase